MSSENIPTRRRRSSGGALVCALVCMTICLCTVAGCQRQTTATVQGEDMSVSDQMADSAGSIASTDAVPEETTSTSTSETAESASKSVPDMDAEPYASASRAGYDLAGVTFGQLIVVDSTETSATVTCYEKDADGVFQQVGSIGSLEGYVGVNGVGTPVEGSGVTPAGLFDIPFTFGNADDPGTKMEFLSVDEDAWWSSEEGDGTYNAYVESSDDLGGDSEHLASIGEYYDYAVVIGYNHPSIGSASPDVVEGAGSAFFLHIYDEPTEGCVGVDREGMTAIMLWLDPTKQPHILII